MAKLRVAGRKLMIELRVVAMVEAVGVPALPLCYGIIEYTVSACDPSKLRTQFTRDKREGLTPAAHRIAIVAITY
jgi:hypothetical protein